MGIVLEFLISRSAQKYVIRHALRTFVRGNHRWRQPIQYIGAIPLFYNILHAGP